MTSQACFSEKSGKARQARYQLRRWFGLGHQKRWRYQIFGTQANPCRVSTCATSAAESPVSSVEISRGDRSSSRPSSSGEIGTSPGSPVALRRVSSAAIILSELPRELRDPLTQLRSVSTESTVKRARLSSPPRSAASWSSKHVETYPPRRDVTPRNSG